MLCAVNGSGIEGSLDFVRTCTMSAHIVIDGIGIDLIARGDFS